ncbi:MAG: glycerol-3-phosphate 1-O-acyltransferase PlsY, partial [Firmicutes bacterium]|nr:glycerol-3-phosphate 1-O-acyltransferase PlsY [Bacillota bacterium]
GATNVLRTLGIKIALLSLVGDLLKGVLAAWLGLFFGGVGLAALCAIAVVAGHCWPVFLGFRGGKGVATSAGVILLLMPLIGLIMAVTFVTVIAVSRFVSLGSVCAAVLFPILILVMKEPWQYLMMGLVMVAMVLFRHRTNIERLRQGTERKIGEKAS